MTLFSHLCTSPSRYGLMCTTLVVLSACGGGGGGSSLTLTAGSSSSATVAVGTGSSSATAVSSSASSSVAQFVDKTLVLPTSLEVVTNEAAQ